MRLYLLLLLAVTSTSTCFALPSQLPVQETKTLNPDNDVVNQIITMVSKKYCEPQPLSKPLNSVEIKKMMQQEAVPSALADKVLTTLTCAKKYNQDQNNILTLIDYSLPSNERRLWVFDLNNKKLLFHTYVAHGVRSGYLSSNYFSNKNNSRASSLGVYNTEKSYYGRHGLSLKLDGLERNFNDNASSRAVVMHGGWYVEESFIKKYGRAGRSWGCPAVPDNLTELIINTIKDKSLMVVYYPSENWLVKSKFLNCNTPSSMRSTANLQPDIPPTIDPSEPQESVLFTDQSNRREEGGTVATITADNYERIFHTKAPLTRMLRRQINNIEYVALSDKELGQMVTSQNQVSDNSRGNLDVINFVRPEVIMVRGYYATEMRIVNLGKIKEIKFQANSSADAGKPANYTVYFEQNKSVNLRAVKQFIRWLGL